MNSREIELVLKARLESSDAASSAVSVGNEISNAIMQSFDGLGEKLGAKLVAGIRQAMQGQDFLGGGSGGQVDTSQPITSFRNQARVNGEGVQQLLPGFDGLSTAGAPQYGSAAVNNNPIPSAVSTGAGNFGDSPTTPYSFRSSRLGAASSLVSSVGEWDKLSGSQYSLMSASSIAGAQQLDIQGSAYSRFKTIQKLDPNAKLEDWGLSKTGQSEYAEQMKAAALKSAKTMTDLDKALADLVNTIASKTDKLNQIKDPKSEEYNSARNELDKDRSRLGALQAERTDAADALNMASKEYQNNKVAKDPTFFNRYQGDIISGLGAAAYGLNLASNYHNTYQSNLASQIDTDRMGTRAFLDKDYTSILATEKGGGYDALKKNATHGAYMSLWGRAIEAGAGIAGIAASAGGTILSGGLGAIPAGMLAVGSAGAALHGTSSLINEYQNFDTNVNQRIKDEQGSLIGQNKEWFDSFKSGRANSIGAYGDSINMGSQDYYQSLSGFRADGAPGVFQNSMGSGLSMSSMASNQKTYNSLMGGQYGYYKNVLEQQSLEDQMARVNTLQGFGYRSAARVAGQLYQGGEQGYMNVDDRNAAFDASSSMFLANKKAGLEAGANNSLMEATGDRAASGLDMTSTAMYENNQVASYASANNMNNGNQVGFLNRVQQNFTDSLNGGGIQGLAKYRAIDQIEKELKAKGVTLAPHERIALQTGTIGKEAIARIGKRGGLSKSDAQGIFSNYSKNVKSEYNQFLKNNSGGTEEGRMVANVLNSPGKTASEKLIGGDFNGSESADQLPSGNIKDLVGSNQGKEAQSQNSQSDFDSLSLGMKSLASGFAALQKQADLTAASLKKIADENLGASKPDISGATLFNNLVPDFGMSKPPAKASTGKSRGQ